MADETTNEDAAAPGTAETPVTPETPVEPEAPDTPEAPATPERPVGPQAVPEIPAEPVTLTITEVQAWKGFRLDDMGGATIGKIEGAYVDEQTGEPEWLLARMGRFGHHCLIPARDAVAAAGHVWVPYSRDQVRKAPRIESGKPLERDLEASLLEHYGVGSGAVGRGADLAALEASAITARPAG